MGLDEVTYSVITRNRPDSMCLVLAAMLSETPGFELLIYDSSDEPIQHKENVAALAKAVDAHGIFVHFEVGPKEGIPRAFQRCAEMARTPYVIRQEDDQIPEAGYVEALYRVMKATAGTRVLGVGGLMPSPAPGAFYIPEPLPAAIVNGCQNIKANEHICKAWQITGDYYEFYDQQQRNYTDDRCKTTLFRVPHLHGVFMYDREKFLANGGFWTDATWIGHREETYVTLRDYFAGWDWLVYPGAKTWHLQATSGGSRDGFKDGAHNPPFDSKQPLRVQDEHKFQAAFKGWMKDHPERPIHIGEPRTYVPPAGTVLRYSPESGTVES